MAKMYLPHRQSLSLLLALALAYPSGTVSLHIPSRLCSDRQSSAFFSESVSRSKSNTHLEEVTTSSAADAGEAGEAKGTTTLVFRGSTTYTTDEVPRRSSSGKTVEEFFAAEENRDILLSGSGNVVEALGAEGTTAALLCRWARETERVGSAPPAEGDTALHVTTTGIEFPGLKLLSVATIGPRLLEGDAETASSSGPHYEFTLIADAVKAEGPRPLKWVFRRLTEFGRSKDGKTKADGEQMTHSLSRVRIKPAEGGSNGVVFTADASLEVEVKFPSFLLKILPVSKEKAEEQGSVSIQKAVEKDLGPSMEKFREAYLKLES